MAHDSLRSLLHGAACDVSLNAIDSYDKDIQSRYCSFILGPPVSKITAMPAPAPTRSGSPKGHSQCHGLCCISSPVSAPSTHRWATTAAMQHVQVQVQVQLQAPSAACMQVWLTCRRLTAEPSLANSQSDRGIQHHHRLCLRWAESIAGS